MNHGRKYVTEGHSLVLRSMEMRVYVVPQLERILAKEMSQNYFFMANTPGHNMPVVLIG